MSPSDPDVRAPAAGPELDEESVVVLMLRAYNWTPSVGQQIAQEP